MAHFVRCIDGHVFDASKTTICPICGAVVAGLAAAVEEPPSSTPQAAAVTGSARHMPLLAGIALLVFGGGAGALLYVLHRPGPPAAVSAVSSTNKGPNKAASSGTSAPSPPVVAAPVPAPPSDDHTTSQSSPAAAPRNQAFSAPVPPSPIPAEPAQPSQGAVNANISDTLQTTLDLIRTFVAFRARRYSDVLSMAEPLISRNNPVAMYFKAGILTNGLAGQRDLSQARALLRDAAQRGDPTSLLFMARFLEKGIGGPQDLDTAKRLYILAAQGMANGADQDVARLGLGGDVGLTALQAYRTLSAGNATPEAMRDAGTALWNLAHQGLTPAVCLSAQLFSLAKARGWNVAKLSTGAQVGSAQSEALRLNSFQYGAPRGDPWCEWGMGEFASTGGQNYPKNLVEADVFYRLTMLNTRLGADAKQVKQQLAAVEGQMTPEEKAQANGLFHSAIPASMAP